ncbi:MAG: BatD family protein [Candidatus Hodarchaeota archaeon]
MIYTEKLCEEENFTIKYNKKMIGILVILLFLFIVLTYSFKINFGDYFICENEKFNNDDFEENNPEIADIAGTDLYAEQINAFVAGDKSLIKQSLFTNDTSILSQFDTNDPAFYKCNILLSASNAINPEIFPRVLTDNDISTEYVLSFNGFAGFLYYDNDIDPNDAQLRAERALEIIKRKFQIDLIMLNLSEPYFFPFIGHYPNWEIYFQEITTNLPMDGYWKALDIDRLTSENYLNNYHVSSTIMFINTLDFFEGDFDIKTDQVNFNIDSLDLTFLENLQTEELTAQFETIIENYGDILNATISEEELEQFIDLIGSFTLSNDSHYTSLMVQYEGREEGTEIVGPNQYTFNLWNALGYNGDPLGPSEKIYIALAGAFLSDIEIKILSTDIIDFYPQNLQFNDFLLEQIGLIFYLTGVDFDIQALKDYSFDLFWFNEEGVKKSYITPVNLNDPYDIVNFLRQLGFQGFTFVPTGILNPISEFTVTYNISNAEQNLRISKELLGDNASYGAYRDFQFYITAKNIGNTTIWGVPTPIPFTLDDFFLLLTLGNQPLADQFKNTIWEIVRIEYPNQYDSLEDFFNFDEDPRIFYFDSLGIGMYDYFFPDLTNFSNLWPYNEEMDNVIDIIITGYPQLIAALGALGLTPNELKDIFTNSNSIWNDDNWKIEPEGIISYIYSNFSIDSIDTFTPFYTSNFTIKETFPEFPAIISGVTIGETTPQMALEIDNESWNIESEERYVDQHEIEIHFQFKNDTLIDLVNNTLERVSILINFSDPSNNLNFEIFNYSIGEYQDINPYITSQVNNNSLTFSFINYGEGLDWLFDPSAPNDYVVFLKIYGIDSDLFNISINDLDIEFYVRDINNYDVLGSRVAFSSSSGNVQFEVQSNSITLSTYDMASIVAFSYLTKYNSKVGDVNTYVLIFRNIGSNIAKNISISLLIPGIMNNSMDFTLKNNNLTYNLSELFPNEEIIINFSFYTPNTRSISNVQISYDNPEYIEGGNSSKLTASTNEVYISAPVDYERNIPFVRTVEIDYFVSNQTPKIGDIFNITVYIENTGPLGLNIPNLNISMRDQFGDLSRIDNNDFTFNNTTYNKIISFNITFKKKDWKGYYYPAINYFESSESRTIQIYSSQSIILGTISFSLNKSVNKVDIDIGDKIIVNINIENTGSICIKNIRINDMISYSQSDFQLVEGKLVNTISSINPGEQFSFNYTLKAKKQGIVSLKPASISYYYLLKQEVQSNEIRIKIKKSQIEQLYYIMIPCIIVLTIFGIYIWQINKYKLKRHEFRRSERELFKLSSRDSILKIEHTLRERLNIINRQNDSILRKETLNQLKLYKEEKDE